MDTDGVLTVSTPQLLAAELGEEAPVRRSLGVGGSTLFLPALNDRHHLSGLRKYPDAFQMPFSFSNVTVSIAALSWDYLHPQSPRPEENLARGTHDEIAVAAIHVEPPFREISRRLGEPLPPNFRQSVLIPCRAFECKMACMLLGSVLCFYSLCVSVDASCELTYGRRGG